MTPAGRRGKPLGNLPVFKTQVHVHVILNFGEEKYDNCRKVTCPRCGKSMVLLDDPGETVTAPCYFCFKTNKVV